MNIRQCGQSLRKLNVCVCANTASFTAPTLADCPIDVMTVSSSTTCSPDAAYVATARSAGAKKKQLKARKAASITDLRQYGKQFTEAKKAEYESWKQDEVFELVDMRKCSPKNFVTGRWVLTVKRNADGTFQKCKARWVLRGFQDKEKMPNRQIHQRRHDLVSVVLYKQLPTIIGIYII